MLLSLVPFVLMPVFYAMLVKVAAFLLRRIDLSWKHALLFGLIALTVGALGTFANLATGQALPALLAGLLGISIQLALAGWYFGSRARTASGELIGFTRGALLSLVALGLVFAIGLGAAVLLELKHAGQS